MATVSLPDVLALKSALQGVRAQPASNPIRDHQLATLEFKQQTYIDQLVLEGVPESDPVLVALRSL